ncbi:hypothetical protein ACKS0A_00537 [Histoplasma ohiense]
MGPQPAVPDRQLRRGSFFLWLRAQSSEGAPSPRGREPVRIGVRERERERERENTHNQSPYVHTYKPSNFLKLIGLKRRSCPGFSKGRMQVSFSFLFKFFFFFFFLLTPWGACQWYF